MQTNYKIIWQKWQDELLDDMFAANNVANEDEDLDEIDDQYDDPKHDNLFSKKQPILITPMGILPYNEAVACNKIFNLWVGHTNFTINKTIMNLIEQCDGVETLDVFTRYRFRISVGQAFSDSIVMRNINNHIYDYLHEPR
jgi:hypothetical protein